MGNMVTKNPVERIARIMPTAAEDGETAAEGENSLPSSVEPQLPAPGGAAPAEAVEPPAVQPEPAADFTQLNLFADPQDIEPDQDEQNTETDHEENS